eukprot:5958592-Pyramimonas_sp.AAC.1
MAPKAKTATPGTPSGALSIGKALAKGSSKGMPPKDAPEVRVEAAREPPPTGAPAEELGPPAAPAAEAVEEAPVGKAAASGANGPSAAEEIPEDATEEVEDQTGGGAENPEGLSAA